MCSFCVLGRGTECQKKGYYEIPSIVTRRKVYDVGVSLRGLLRSKMRNNRVSKLVQHDWSYLSSMDIERVNRFKQTKNDERRVEQRTAVPHKQMPKGDRFYFFIPSPTILLARGSICMT